VVVASGLYEQMHNRIRTRFDAQVVDGGDVARVVYPNEREVPPSNSAWVELQVEDTDTEQNAFGGSLQYRKRGNMRAIIRGPLGVGDALSLRLLDAIRTKFNRVIDSTVFYGATSAGGFRRNEQFWQIESVTPFYSDDTETRAANVGAWSLVDREAAFNSIRSRFDTLFGSSGSVSTNTVVYDNDPTDPPNDTQWVSLSINTGLTEVVGAGSSAQARTIGIATAMIFTPLGMGTASALNLADDIIGKFRSLTDNGVVYETPYLLTVGNRGQWWQTNCNIRFRLEEVL